ncbi:MAG: [NiFe]-hydrogenase assembly chaperone HybE [Burkholderiales bacterium]|nr:[NiFe]-hydrogenase assembly chaperone HybE [Burkholderiales bacterium]
MNPNENQIQIQDQNIEWKPSPVQRLERGFHQVLEKRMQGLPFVHPKVGIHAVGFQKWKYFWLGIMVTPWAINIILTEGDPTKWKSVPEGKKLHYRFPAGLYDFISVKDDLLGEYKMCSLISPLTEIKDDAMAVEVAQYALQELMKDEQPEEEGTPMVYSPREVNPEAVEAAIEKKVEETMSKPISRRSFFKRKFITKEK